MIDLYSPEEARLWRRKAACSLRLIRCLFAAAMVFGTLLCLFTRTRTALLFQWIAVLQCAVLGWTAILLAALVYRPSRAEATHMEGILSAGEPEICSGQLTLTDAAFAIPGSVTACRATLRSDSESGPVTRTLNLDAARISRLPSASFSAEIASVRSFVTAFRPLAPAEPAGPVPVRKRPVLFRRLASLFPMLLVWGALSLLLWSWIFSLITDAAPARKVSLYVDAPVSAAAELAASLEESLPAGIRLVEIRPFSYFMMNGDALALGDLYILPESAVEAHRDWFCPVPDALSAASGLFSLDGIPMGLPVYDAASGLSIAGTHIAYADPALPGRRWLLCFGARSLHLPDHEGAVDEAAVAVAEALLRIQ